MSKTVFVTGATGLVGSRLVAALRERGDAVLALSRRPGPDTIEGDPSVPGPWLDLLDSCDAVVHLAGENIFAKRWSTSFMKRIHDSRVVSTRLIAERLAKSGNKAVVFVSCSAIGYYGDPKTDFMANVCHEWEVAADPARFAGNRVVHPRLGIVLDPKGGALANLVRPYRFFVGGRIGSGKQIVSWIHHEDLTRLLMFAIDTPALSGPVNATAPHPVSNDELGRAIGKVLGRPHWLPVPRWALRIALGKIADVLLAGGRVSSEKVIQAGFTFRFPELEPALRDLIGR
jgi:uncharacterized protein (TIGR01777 family)